MTRAWRPSLVLLLAAAGFAVAAVKEPPPRVEVRDGLGNVRAKLEAGEPVTVVYVGGSITELPGWRDRVTRHLWRRHGEEAIRSINAGLSATGSDVAVCRLDDEVLAREPDLVVIEFAVNDAGAGPATIRAAVEGMVRKIWARDPATDILFVYLFAPEFEDAIASGARPPSIKTHESVATHYGIPSIDASVVVEGLHREGRLTLAGPKNAGEGGPEVFAPDGIHPYSHGQGIYGRAVVAGLDAIWSDSENGGGPHRLESRLSPDPWESARKVPLAAWMRGDGWRPVTGADAAGFESRAIEVFESPGEGATIEFGFRGTVLKVYEVRNIADPGQLEILVDGKPLEEDSFRPLNVGPRLRVLHVRHRFGGKKVQRVVLRAGPGIRLGDLLVRGEVVR